jgi:purine-binding chemotaxis protein CheW
MKPRSFCTFRVDNLTVGVDVTRVQEVLRTRPVTPVPLSEPCVAGILNLRGQIVTVVDMRSRFGLDASTATGRAVHVVVESRGEVLSLVVDSEGDVVDIDEDNLENVTEVVDDAIGSCVVGTSKVDDTLLLVLDPDRVLSGLAPSA